MPDFTIETTYHLPIFRHRTYAAATLDAACRTAVDDDYWDIAERDYDSAGEVHITGVWEGAHSAYTGPLVPVPSQFDEAVQRRARQFEILLGLLKIFFDDAHAARPPSPDWLIRSAWEIARGEAILGNAPDPDQAVEPQRATHVLGRLQEEQVRNAIAAVLEVDDSFGALSPAAVTDDDIHTACLTVATTMDVSDVVGNAEFQAALAAVRAAHQRLHPD